MSKLAYPKGRLLLVRDCTVDICLKNNPGSVLLSVLLFWYDNPHKGDFYNEQEGTFTVCRTQEDIELQSCDQIDAKTIHNVAVPLLQLFGYLEIKEKMYGNLYTVNIRQVEAAYAAYSKGPGALVQFLKSSVQLEKFLIELTEDELEKILINKKFLLLQLEKILIQNRKISNCKRGRKPRLQATSEAKTQNIEILRDSIEIDTKRESSAFAPSAFLPTEEECTFSDSEDDQPTEYRLPAIPKETSNGHIPPDRSSNHSRPDSGNRPVMAAEPDQPPPFSVDAPASASPRRESGASSEKPKRRKKPVEVQLSLREAEIKQWYEELRGVEVSFSKRNVAALQALGKRTMSKDDFLNVVACLDADPWFEKNSIGVDLFWIERQWENKIIFLRRKRPKTVDAPVNATSTPKSVYTTVSALMAYKQQAREGGTHD